MARLSRKLQRSKKDSVSAHKLGPKTPITGPGGKPMSNRMRKRLRKRGKLP